MLNVLFDIDLLRQDESFRLTRKQWWCTHNECCCPLSLELTNRSTRVPVRAEFGGHFVEEVPELETLVIHICFVDLGTRYESTHRLSLYKRTC